MIQTISDRTFASFSPIDVNSSTRTHIAFTFLIVVFVKHMPCTLLNTMFNGSLNFNIIISFGLR